jgi:hypothetical protein
VRKRRRWRCLLGRAPALPVTAVEQVEQGNVFSRPCDHQGPYPLQHGFSAGNEQLRRELLRCAYGRINLTRDRLSSGGR